MKLSRLAESITSSPILTIAAEINAKIAAGTPVHNLTVGDFDPDIFPIPEALTEATIEAYRQHHTNYPGAYGIPELRHGVAETLNRLCGLDYQADDIQIASGSRPLIYTSFQAVLDPGDKVVFPVPSWNNDYYTQLTSAAAVTVETSPDNHFMPTAEALEPHLKGARLLALCSPQNPTGTVFTREGLKAICELVISENQQRYDDEKPLYVMFDQVYWLLTFGSTEFFHPLSICPDIRPYAIFIDGLSKSFAGTGIRVGWATAPDHLLPRMRALLAHIGAWAPKPEQVATGHFLANTDAVDSYLHAFTEKLESRLQTFYDGFMALKADGYPVDAIAPQAAIYLSVKIDLVGKTTADGTLLDTTDAVQNYLLNVAGVGILPFSWFGAKTYGEWYRLSVGTCETADIPAVLTAIREAIDPLG